MLPRRRPRGATRLTDDVRGRAFRVSSLSPPWLGGGGGTSSGRPGGAPRPTSVGSLPPSNVKPTLMDLRRMLTGRGDHLHYGGAIQAQLDSRSMSFGAGSSRRWPFASVWPEGAAQLLESRDSKRVTKRMSTPLVVRAAMGLRRRSKEYNQTGSASNVGQSGSKGKRRN